MPSSWEIVTIVIVIVLMLCFSKMSRTEVTYVTSDHDNKEYLVVNVPDKRGAARILGSINSKINKLIDHLKKTRHNHKSHEKYIDQLCARTEGLVLSENSPGGKYTSYTVNKGEEISLCLRNKDGEFHEENVIMYVTIHELSHVACPEQDHTDLFKGIFVFLLETSVSIKIYDHVDYRSSPVEYCGMTITENLLR